MTAHQPLSCPKCRVELNEQLPPVGAAQPCVSCRRPLEGIVFPAYFRPAVTGKQAEAVLTSEDASCFYHPASRAQSPCDVCGRFLCALCDIEVQGEHYCPACMNAGRKKKQIRNLDGDRMLYGGLALLIAIVPLIAMWPITIVTGPLTLVVAAIGFRKPKSLVGSGRIALVLAILIGLLEVGGWLLLFFGVLKYMF